MLTFPSGVWTKIFFVKVPWVYHRRHKGGYGLSVRPKMPVKLGQIYHLKSACVLQEAIRTKSCAWHGLPIQL